MQPGDVVAERFEIVGAATAGGMAQVYRAHDRRTSGPVALKISQGEAARFMREARVLAELRHPNIVQYVAHGTTEDGELFLAMEWLEGHDLAHRLKRTRLTVEESVTLTRTIAATLVFAHDRGVIHRDIKPSNIFVRFGDLAQLTLLDFGVAYHGRATTALTLAGSVLGTPGYMAPEQAGGRGPVDARSDLFSLGCILFRCLTGRAPFRGADHTAVLAKILLEAAPRPSEIERAVPPQLDELVLRMLAKDPAERPADMRALVGELDRMVLDAPADASLQSKHLGTSEQRLLTVLVASPNETENDATTSSELMRVADGLGGKLVRLQDGSLLVSASRPGIPADQATLAARCALALAEHLPGATMVLASGHGTRAGVPVGEVIERAVKILRREEHDGPTLAHRPAKAPRSDAVIVLDDETANVLEGRFEIAREGGAPRLRGRRAPFEGTRTLLGRKTSCVGRDRELATLEALLDESAGEKVARGALVIGPAGAGKSRLVHELVQRARARQDPPEIFVANGDPVGAGSSLGMAAQLVRHAAWFHEGEPLERRRAKLVARVTERVPPKDRRRVTVFLGELTGTPFPVADDAQLGAAQQDPRLMRDQIRAAFEDWLLHETDARPVVAILEDIHWGDLASIKLIEAAITRLEDRAIFFCVLTRPEGAPTYALLQSIAGFTSLALGELPRRASAALVREVLGTEVDAPTVDSLVMRAEGNPFYLEELIRATAAGSDRTLPTSVLGVVESRLLELDPEARRVLRAASTFGQVFWVGGVQALLGGTEGDFRLGDWLYRLIDRELIAQLSSERFPGEPDYVFRHAFVRDAAYAMLTDADRALAHRLAGLWLEKVGERDPMIVSEHYERGGDAERAIPWYLRAAEAARDADDFANILAHGERAVLLGARGETLGAIRQLQAEAHWGFLDTAKMRSAGEEALTLLPRGSAPWFDASRDVAQAARAMGDSDRIRQIGEALLTLDAEPVARVRQVHAMGSAARQLQMIGMQPMAEALVGRMQELAATLTDHSEIVAAWTVRARAQLKAYPTEEEYLELLDAARTRFDAVGDRRQVVEVSGDIGDAYSQLGLFAEAENAFREVLALCQRLRFERRAAVVRINLGLVLARRGEFEEAIALVTSAVETFRGEDVQFEGMGRCYLALVLLAAGRVDAARREAADAAENLIAEPLMRPYALAIGARLDLLAGRTEAALASAREAHDTLESIGRIEEGEAFVRLVFAETLHAMGDPEGARKTIATARDKLLARASTLPNLRFRQSFLENVEEHARTLALADAWL